MHNFRQIIKKLTAFMLVIMMLVGSMSFSSAIAWQTDDAITQQSTQVVKSPVTAAETQNVTVQGGTLSGDYHWTNQLEKSVVYNNDVNDSFDITLKVKPGEISPEPSPAVVILVCDISYSMVSNSAGTDGKTYNRLSDLKAAVNSFGNAFLNGKNYLALVTYSKEAKKIEKNSKNYFFGSNDIQTLNTKVNALTSTSGNDGGTNTQGGLSMAKNILDNLKTNGLPDDISGNTNTKYYVILMSDGGANSYYDNGGIDGSRTEGTNANGTQIAQNKAIDAFNALKASSHSPTVYSVGFQVTTQQATWLSELADPGKSTTVYTGQALTDIYNDIQKQMTSPVIEGIKNGVARSSITDTLSGYFDFATDWFVSAGVKQIDGSLSTVYTDASNANASISRSSNTLSSNTLTWNIPTDVYYGDEAYITVRVVPKSSAYSDNNSNSNYIIATNTEAQLQYQNIITDVTNSTITANFHVDDTKLAGNSGNVAGQNGPAVHLQKAQVEIKKEVYKSSFDNTVKNSNHTVYYYETYLDDEKWVKSTCFDGANANVALFKITVKNVCTVATGVANGLSIDDTLDTGSLDFILATNGSGASVSKYPDSFSLDGGETVVFYYTVDIPAITDESTVKYTNTAVLNAGNHGGPENPDDGFVVPGNETTADVTVSTEPEIDPYVAIKKVIQNNLHLAGDVENSKPLSGFTFKVYAGVDNNGAPVGKSLGTLEHSGIDNDAIYYYGHFKLITEKTYYVFEESISGYTPGQPYVEVTAYVELEDAIGAAPDFINILDPSKTPVQITKTLNGTATGGFDFTITCTDLKYNATATSGSDGVVDFGKLPVGYTYTIKEDLKNSEITDKTEEITVTIDENGYVTYSKTDGIYENVTKTSPIEITKTVDGKVPAAGETFTFSLYNGTILLKTVESDAAGRVSFGEFAAGTYTIKEDLTTAQTSRYTKPNNDITVVISKGSAVYTGLTNNAYNNTRKPVDITIQKYLDGAVYKTANTFTFTLTGKDLSGNAVSITAKNDANGNVIFKNVPVGGPYTIKETAVAGYTDVTVSITVSVGVNGTVTGTSATSNISKWENTTKTYPITITKQLDKKVAQGFKFELYNSSNVKVGEATSDAKGIVSFGNFAPGTYTIKEVGLDTAKYTDDTGSITVTINAAGTVTYTNNAIYSNTTKPPFTPDPKCKIKITKTIDGKLIADWAASKKYTTAQLKEIFDGVTFKLYPVNSSGASTTGVTAVATGKVNITTGVIEFSTFIPRIGWYAVVEELTGKAATTFNVSATLYVYYRGNNASVSYFDYNSKYTIVNGYSQPGRRNVGYNTSVLYQGGNLFYIGVKNSKGTEYPSFCCNPSSANFAGESNVSPQAKCTGYMVTSDMSVLNGVDAQYMLSALNYIEDKFGALKDNRIVTQIVIWKLLIDGVNGTTNKFDINTIKKANEISGKYSSGDGLTPTELSRVKEVLANYKNYVSPNNKIKDLVYLTCDQNPLVSKGVHGFGTCQPQIVPVYGDGVLFNNKCK